MYRRGFTDLGAESVLGAHACPTRGAPGGSPAPLPSGPAARGWGWAPVSRDPSEFARLGASHRRGRRAEPAGARRADRDPGGAAAPVALARPHRARARGDLRPRRRGAGTPDPAAPPTRDRPRSDRADRQG